MKCQQMLLGKLIEIGKLIFFLKKINFFSLQITDILGEGAFGEVWKGKLKINSSSLINIENVEKVIF